MACEEVRIETDPPGARLDDPDHGVIGEARWGADWLDARELEERLGSSKEFVVSFEGEFHYDEDMDGVHPREFRDSFEQAAGVAIVFQHEGAILTSKNYSWPNALTGRAKPQDSNVAALVRDVVARVWVEGFEEQQTDRTVGRVGNYEDIVRSVMVFRRLKVDEA
jgi:hypothetical protein